MSLPARVVPTQILPAVLKLLRLRWQINYNSFRHAKTKTKIWTVIGLAGIFGFSAFIFWVSTLLLVFLRSPAPVKYLGAGAGFFLEAMPALVLSTMFIGILLTSFGVLLQALYLSGDMDFLLTVPVPVRAVFITKLLQAVLPNFSLMALFGLPVLYGLGISGGYNFIYYPGVLIMMISMTLAAAGLSALLVMAVVRVFPARRVAEVLGFFGALFSMVVSQSGNLSNSLGRAGGSNPAQLDKIFNLAKQVSMPWLPLNWAGNGLVDLGEGRWISGIMLVTLAFGLCVAVFWFSLITAESWYYTGWARMQVVSTKKKTSPVGRISNDKPAFVSAVIERLFPVPVRAIVRRDFLILTRDLRHMSQMISPLIFGLLYSFMLFRSGTQPPVERGESTAWFMESFRTLMVYGNVGMSLIVGWMILGQLSGNGISREGKTYWVLKSAPLRSEHLLAAKFIVAYLPALGLGWFFLTGISILQGISLIGFLYGLLVVAMCLAGLNGIQLGFGALGANLAWEDPRKINSGQMGCLGSILTGIFLPLAFGSFIAPLWVAAAFHQPLNYAYPVGIIIGVSFNGICLWLPLKMAEGKLAKLGEA